MDTLGIGSNMVKSMRFWMQAVGITEEPSRGRRSQNIYTAWRKDLSA